MKLSSKIRPVVYLLLALMMPLVVLLSATLHYAYSEAFFLNAFEADSTAQRLGLDAPGMEQVAKNLTGYMSGREAAMDVQVPVEGKMTRFYNDKELAHMVDVRNLMVLGERVRSIMLFASLLLLTGLRRFSGREAFWRGVLASALGALGFAALLGILALNDFSGAFYKFHEIFFTNELWLLDPATDRLIQMLPESFFFAITARILTASGLSILLMGAFSLWRVRRYRSTGLKEGAHADTL